MISAIVSGVAIILAGIKSYNPNFIENVFLDESIIITGLPGIAFTIAFSVSFRLHFFKDKIWRTAIAWLAIWLFFYLTSHSFLSWATAPLYGALGAHLIERIAYNWHGVPKIKQPQYIIAGIISGALYSILSIWKPEPIRFPFDTHDLSFFHVYAACTVFSWQLWVGLLLCKNLKSQALYPKINQIGKQSS
ncbi:MAG: hypothetical protein AB8F95_17765 [Bacteroidia bacterium]